MFRPGTFTPMEGGALTYSAEAYEAMHTERLRGFGITHINVTAGTGTAEAYRDFARTYANHPLAAEAVRQVRAWIAAPAFEFAPGGGNDQGVGDFHVQQLGNEP